MNQMENCIRVTKGRNGNEMWGLVCMKHGVKWLVKHDENDNEILILGKMVTNHKFGIRSH